MTVSPHLPSCYLGQDNQISLHALHPRQLRLKLKSAWQKTPLYGFHLSGKGTHDVVYVPIDSWPGSQTHGRRLVDGTLILGSETTTVNNLWFPDHLSQGALYDLHSFEWLRNLRTLGDNAARRMARHLITNWIDTNSNWRSLSWRVDILGNRLSNWVGLYDFFCASADDLFRQKFFKSLYRQARHLSMNWQDIPSATQQLYALHGLLHVIICLNTNMHRLPNLLSHLDLLLEQQILEDGGHRTRSPHAQLMVLRILIDIRSLLRLVHLEGSSLLQQTIAKMAPIVRLFRHGDGSLSCFGPYSPLSSSLVDMVLSIADVKGRPPFSAPSMGYARSHNKSGLVLLNTRPSFVRAPCVNSEHGTGIFNFEWSAARHRFITFSDIILQNEQGEYAKSIENAQNHLSFDHQIHPEGSLLEAEFHSHQLEWSFRQHRSFFMSNYGPDFRGEDVLSSHIPCDYALRFVFHPDITLTRQGKQIFIDTPDKQRWTFLCSSKNTHLEIIDTFHKSPLLVVIGEIFSTRPHKVRWAFRPA